MKLCLTLFSRVGILLLLCLLVAVTAACGDRGKASSSASEKAIVIDASKPADVSPILVTDFDLEDVLTSGLPVILNFGSDDAGSADTLAALAILHRDIGHLVLIRSVDLAAKPEAREGYPVQVIPTQFFFSADGAPIPLNLEISVLMSGLYLSDTGEPVFTIHEGPLSLTEFAEVLTHMGVVK